MLSRGILGSGQTRGVSLWPFQNSSGWWWLISSIFLIRISCHKTTHANGYYGAWPGWAVSISVLPLTQVLNKSHSSFTTCLPTLHIYKTYFKLYIERPQSHHSDAAAGGAPKAEFPRMKAFRQKELLQKAMCKVLDQGDGFIGHLKKEITCIAET